MSPSAARTLPPAPASSARPVGTEPLSAREARIVEAIARAALPPGRALEGGGPATALRFEAWLAGTGRAQRRVLRALLWSAEAAAVPVTGRPFTSLEPPRAAAFLESWAGSESALRRTHLRAILSVIKVAHFDDPRQYAAVACPSFHEAPSAPTRLRVIEAPRWLQQVTDGRRTEEDLALECEVVVVGTGAGGAAAAYELASRGRAVLLLEEGDYVRRDRLSGRTQPMMKKLYREQGLTVAMGNVSAPVFAGRGVGGSTLINSGTCYRATERVFSRWRSELGLAMFSADAMAPYYERVERMLQVERAPMALTGGVGRVIARGAEALGLTHHPIARNAPGCDGQGTCAFGCPTGAKRSTDVSYVPAALERGAALITGARVDGIASEGGRATGVQAKLRSGHRLTVKAQAVVVAGGALMTPLLLKRAGVCKGSRMLGKNLSIHPASKVMALFDETIDMATGIPQGYAIDEYAGEGIMLEGGSVPLEIAAVGIPWIGQRFMDLMDAYRQLATFGFLVEDTSRGEVRAGYRGAPLITYSLNAHDVKKIQRAIAILSDVYLAAGAKRVFPFLPGMEELSTYGEVVRLRDMPLKAGDLEITAYHPLGTCRIGTDPETSVLGPDHEAHELAGLYVTDGAAVPTALGVNPQMTIMAMALRAAEIIDARLGA